MVLSKLRMLGMPADVADDGRRRIDDGSPLTFPQLLDDNQRQYGGRVAFQQKLGREWQRISHADVHRRAHELAAGLVSLGLRQGDRVAIVGENSIDWVLAYYAVVIAGGVGVPLYYDLKPSEIAEMVERSDARLAFVSAKALPKFERSLPGVETIIELGGEDERRAGVPGGLLRRARPEIIGLREAAERATSESRVDLGGRVVGPDDLASLVFTSGTTGGMKGVMLTHRNFMSNVWSIRRSIPFNDHDRIVMVLPMHHAFPFIVGMAVAPAVGGELTFENDLRRIRDRMAEVKPTLFLGVPQLFEVMYRNIVHGIEVQGRLESFEKGLRIVEATKKRTGVNIGRIVFRELHKRLGGSLRFMVSGGAALNPQVALNFARLGVPIIQGWGLSESSPVLSAQRWSPRKFYMSNYYEEHFGTVGPPVEGVEVALIDVPEKELYVHLHGEGELVARGDNISPGYWKAPEASEAAKAGVAADGGRRVHRRRGEHLDHGPEQVRHRAGLGREGASGRGGGEAAAERCDRGCGADRAQGARQDTSVGGGVPESRCGAAAAGRGGGDGGCRAGGDRGGDRDAGGGRRAVQAADGLHAERHPVAADAAVAEDRAGADRRRVHVQPGALGGDVGGARRGDGAAGGR